MILLLDNFDSFTYTLKDYLSQFGKEVQVLRNNQPLTPHRMDKIEALVISPGPETPQKSGYLMEYLNYFWGKIPILGVCLGHQAIGMKLGASLKKGHQPRHGKLTRIRTIKDSILFEGISNTFEVVQYNSLVLYDLEAKFITAISSFEEIMAIEVPGSRVLGVQFHPEAHLTQFGKKMIENWLKLIK